MEKTPFYYTTHTHRITLFSLAALAASVHEWEVSIFSSNIVLEVQSTLLNWERSGAAKKAFKIATYAPSPPKSRTYSQLKRCHLSGFDSTPSPEIKGE